MSSSNRYTPSIGSIKSPPPSTPMERRNLSGSSAKTGHERQVSVYLYPETTRVGRRHGSVDGRRDLVTRQRVCRKSATLRFLYNRHVPCAELKQRRRSVWLSYL